MPKLQVFLKIILYLDYKFLCININYGILKIMYPIRTLVKFYENQQKNSNNKIITRTLLKIGIIDTKWLVLNTEDTWPVPGELWIVDIIDEIEPGEAKGCFLLNPIKKVESIVPLFPGMYTEEHVNGKLILTPTPQEDINWMLPIKIKQLVKTKNLYATIIKIENSTGKAV